MMKGWETRLFRSDTTMDIIGDYEILLSYGVNLETAFAKIKEVFLDEYIGSGEEDVFWITVAYVNWKYGIKNDYVLEKALEFLDNEDCMGTWEFENEIIKLSRLNALAECKYHFQFVERPYKKPPKPPLALRQKTKLQKGDVIAYQLGSPYLDEVSERLFSNKPYLNKKWVLLRVIKIGYSPVTYIAPELDYSTFPCVALYNRVFEEKPSCVPIDAKFTKIGYRVSPQKIIEADVLQLDDNVKPSFYKVPANASVIQKMNDEVDWSAEDGYAGNYHEIDAIARLLF